MRPFRATSNVASDSLALNESDSQQMIDFLRILIQTPSHSGEEAQLAAGIRSELGSVGVVNVAVDSAGSVIACLGDGDGPVLLIDSHMDTVNGTETGWQYGLHDAVIEQGNVYGLGACDAKGSIAAMVYSAKRLVDTNAHLHGTLALAFVVQEEQCEGCGLKNLLSEIALKPDWIVLAKPSDLEIKQGHRGRVLFKVTVQGRGSHGSRPDLGKNAIMGAARVIFGIDLLGATLPSDPNLGPGTIAVTHIESQESSPNAIPTSCTFYLDRRLTAGETITRAKIQIEEIIQREEVDASVEIMGYQGNSYSGHEFCVREAFQAWSLDQEDPLIAAMAQTASAVLDRAVPVSYWSFSTDGVFAVNEAHIPTIGFGPGDPDRSHMVDEHVSIQDVASAAQIYASFAIRMLADR